MNFSTAGIHHVTATTDDDQADLDFYAGTLGLPLVKQTVNFDDPSVYHFYYASGAKAVGTVMTTFPYGHRGVRRGMHGSGLVTRVAFSAPADAMQYWRSRLNAHDVAHQEADALGHDALWTVDPSGLPLAVAFLEDPRDAAPGLDPEVALKGVLGVRMTVRDSAPVEEFLRQVFGMTTSRDGGRVYAAGDAAANGPAAAPGTQIEIVEDRSLAPSVNGLGTVHHVAFRAATRQIQADLRDQLLELGLRVTDFKDRKYFRSIYFRDARHTGGVLFEVATDGPGFDADEDPQALGRELRLPPGLTDKDAVRKGLPEVKIPTPEP